MRDCIPADWENTPIGKLTSCFSRDFYLAFPPKEIRATVSLKSPEETEADKRETLPRQLSDGLLQLAATDKSATLSRISGDRGGIVGLASRVWLFPLSVAEAGSLFGSELKALMQELNEVLVT